MTTPTQCPVPCRSLFQQLLYGLIYHSWFQAGRYGLGGTSSNNGLPLEQTPAPQGGRGLRLSQVEAHQSDTVPGSVGGAEALWAPQTLRRPRGALRRARAAAS